MLQMLRKGVVGATLLALALLAGACVRSRTAVFIFASPAVPRAHSTPPPTVRARVPAPLIHRQNAARRIPPGTGDDVAATQQSPGTPECRSRIRAIWATVRAVSHPTVTSIPVDPDCSGMKALHQQILNQRTEVHETADPLRILGESRAPHESQRGIARVPAMAGFLHVAMVAAHHHQGGRQIQAFGQALQKTVNEGEVVHSLP